MYCFRVRNKNVVIKNLDVLLDGVHGLAQLGGYHGLLHVLHLRLLVRQSLNSESY